MMVEMEYTQHECDAIVIGAGSGGLAAAQLLARGGLSVICVEPEQFPHNRVGESLDWSAPDLLRKLGVEPAELTARNGATVKSAIHMEPPDRAPWSASPPRWLRRLPFDLDLNTLHVDRGVVDQTLYELARREGVHFIWDRVTRIHASQRHISAVDTADARTIAAKWVIDASGRKRMLAREFQIPRTTYGVQKVCIWGYFPSPPHERGTTFFSTTTRSAYLHWVWDIPIRPDLTSVGAIMTAEELNTLRRSGMDAAEILRHEMAPHPRFAQLLQESRNVPVSVCTFQPYVHHEASGPNWFMVGEASSMPDPFTGNGVTAAYRQAVEASSAILDSRGSAVIERDRRRQYNRNVYRMGHLLNRGIEMLVYDWPVRVGLGLRAAQTAYASPIWFTNLLYSKLSPTAGARSVFFDLWLLVVHFLISSWFNVARLLCRMINPTRRSPERDSIQLYRQTSGPSSDPRDPSR